MGTFDKAARGLVAAAADRPTPPVPAAEDDAVDPWRVAHERDTAIWAAAHRDLLAERDALRQQVADLRAGIEGLVSHASREVTDAKAGETYAAEVDQGVLLASEQARRYAWETVFRKASALAGSGEQPGERPLPCHQGVRGCTEVGEHYHPDEKYARDTPVVPDSAGLRERVRGMIVATAQREFFNGTDIDALTDDLLAVVGQGVTADTLTRFEAEHARRQRIDDTPCPQCGGDRLRQDFTGSGRCHAPRPAPSTTTEGNDHA